MHVALTLPNTVSRQDAPAWGAQQGFDALSSDALNTSFFMPASQQAVTSSVAVEGLNAATFSTSLKAIAEEHRIALKLNEEFLQLEFSVRDFNRVSFASENQLAVVKPSLRLAEEREEQIRPAVADEMQVAA
jgi:hypothetical protein